MIAFLIANYRPIAGALLAMAFCVFLIHKGYDMCEANHAKAALQANEVKDEIRNQPHSVDITINRLSRATF